MRAVSTYNNGQPYREAKGHVAPRDAVVNHNSTVHPITEGFPTAAEFHRAFIRELKIRCYQPNTIRSYGSILSRFLRWFGNLPHRVTREDVRCFLEDLVDGGARSDWVSQHLAVIRTAFDKLNGRQVTLGLATPRKPKRVPLVLSETEVRVILEAACSLRDKLLIGLMYATGMRISEAVRIRWCDIDFDRRVVNVWQAKGRSDRQVTLPQSFTPILQELAANFRPDAFVFPGEKKGKHLSPRTGERIVTRTVALTGIRKRVTPHSFRHAFATHLLEHGTDIRFIQKLLGHVRLETTTIYTKVAVPRGDAVPSPLDRIGLGGGSPPVTNAPPKSESVGMLRIQLVDGGVEQSRFRVDIYEGPATGPASVQLDDVLVREHGCGWLAVEIPPAELWAAGLERLGAACRRRVQSPEFFQRLQSELIRRHLSACRQ